jgi:pimeloyl-ACP methyl ester carboxylesterase
MRLAHVIHGTDTARPPLLIVHGLFGSARNWGAIARRLSDDRLVVTVDMRNHGQSPWDDRHDYPAMAADLAETLAALVPAARPVDVVGHSMGGKAAMGLALAHPALIRRLVVADIAPVAYTHTQLPLVEAMAALDLTGLATRGDADRRLAPAVPDDATRAFLLQSLDLKAMPPCWRLNLPALARNMQAITGWPEPEGCFDGPTLFLSGARSSYVRPDHRAAIKALFPNAKFAKLPDAGHWLHAERPREFEATLRVFLG